MIRTRARWAAPGEVSQMCRTAVLAWGAAAVSWQLCAPAPDALPARLVTIAAFLLLAAGTALYVRRPLLGELRRTQEIAGAAQQVLLRPLPPRMEGLALAAAQLSASRGAAVGGDLYEAVAGPHGVRVVIGDVRGHGLAALGAAAAVLGSFREAAYDERRLDGVLRRMERALQRHLRDRARSEHPAACAGEPESPVAEEFVTVLLLEIAPDGRIRALNCGHPWPYRLRRVPDGYPGGPGGYADVLAGDDPLPPLGAFPLPAELPVQLQARLLPGEVLFLHTDGAEDARDREGRYFPLRGALTEAAGAAGTVSPAGLVAGVHAALLRHTGGRLADDVALLVVRNDRRRVPAQPHGQAVCRAATPHGT
ncbi:serine/threonine-protein phosphatase [Streptomyces bambusae]|uniref:PP2C family protein-serine/threonine phosphatase n=1 Tax=Streptomyces bambusae TaxID=1550616 RepID=UPI001CFF5E10|nr:PP2C family protein-serine/threonine phosphatase [Streptomyces bambusae]MCB5170281.1 serine/threonine-protein phosphatase [Streptomyces bambusae]